MSQKCILQNCSTFTHSLSPQARQYKVIVYESCGELFLMEQNLDFRADWAVRAVLKFSANLLEYPTFLVFLLIFPWVKQIKQD